MSVTPDLAPPTDLDVLATDDSTPAARSLSPSRAADFLTCPLLYRFRVIDRFPEAPSPAATRGTVVHSVLERLFDLPAGGRTLDAARSMVAPQWAELLEAEPELAGLLDDGDLETDDLPSFLVDADALLARYFALENPQRLEPAERELRVEVELESGLVLRGFVDRLDVAPTGEMRVVDYKTGRAPSPAFESKAMFQMRFYALVLWRLYGRVPRLLQLLYLGSGETLTYEPDEADLRGTQVKVQAIWEAIARATESGDWRASPSKLCDWCDHKARCPEWGGVLPPLPEPVPLVGSVPRSEQGSEPGSVPGQP